MHFLICATGCQVAEDTRRVFLKFPFDPTQTTRLIADEGGPLFEAVAMVMMCVWPEPQKVNISKNTLPQQHRDAIQQIGA